MDAASESNSNSPASGTFIRRLGIFAVLAFASILFFARLGERALWSEEVRWAEIPREMLANNDWFWPTINGRSYYDKPLGSYWLVLCATWLTGAANETAARLPSAISALAAVLFAMLIARRLYGELESLLTGIILATSFAFVFFARNASADMENVAGILIVLWVFVRNEGRPPGLWTLLLWLLMALTSLTKGLLGFAVPILTIGVYCSFATPATPLSRAWFASLVTRNAWLFNRMSLLAIPLAGTVYAAPFLASAVVHPSMDGLAMVYRENLRRFFDPVNHRGPVYLYGYAIFLLLAPWSVLLPAALVHAHGSSGEDRRGRAFALAYFWGTFLFFTLSASRRSYYILPILPAGAFLIARMLGGRIALGRYVNGLLLAGFSLFGVIVMASVALLIPASVLLPAPWDTLPALPAPVAFTLTWLLCAACVAFALRRRQPAHLAASFSLIAASFAVYFFLFALPTVEPYRTQRPFASAVKQEVGADMQQVALWKTREIVYYLEPAAALMEFHELQELQTAIHSGRVRWLILRRRDWDGLSSVGVVRIAEVVHPWDGAEPVQSKLMLVELFVFD